VRVGRGYGVGGSLGGAARRPDGRLAGCVGASTEISRGVMCLRPGVSAAMSMTELLAEYCPVVNTSCEKSFPNLSSRRHSQGRGVLVPLDAGAGDAFTSGALASAHDTGRLSRDGIGDLRVGEHTPPPGSGSPSRGGADGQPGHDRGPVTVVPQVDAGGKGMDDVETTAALVRLTAHGR
jgi:hypothetical protein